MRWKRSPTELAFRAGQEFHNARLWANPPQLTPRTGQVLPLPPNPDLSGTAFGHQVMESAHQILKGRYPLFGTWFDLGPTPSWRLDFVSGRCSARKYFRLVPYLDFDAVGDHKVIWELNRHQWLVLLAMAAVLTPECGDRERYRQTVAGHLDHWIRANPFQEGINWCSALEVAFRALSWIWIQHLIAPEVSGFLASLYRHGLHIERNLSVYFSPNTHLLGEAVVLHALGAAFPDWPRAGRWRELGGRIVQEQLERQILPDGSHFEQSSYYHVYALDMFLLHRVFGGHVPDERLAAMADYLHALLGPRRSIPLIGDDDGGRLFHPYGPSTEFGRATLATSAILLGRKDWPYDPADLHVQAAWWLGAGRLQNEPNSGRPQRPASFRDAGTVALARGQAYVLFDAGPFGRPPAGHSHADTLSVIVCSRGREILVDSGTFTYVADPVERDRFRGTGAHNTVRVDGLDQAQPAGPFRWLDPPQVQLFQTDEASAEAVCQTPRYRHHRRIRLSEDELLVEDHIEGGNRVEQFWHLGPEADPACVGAYEARVRTAPRSIVYGQKFDGKLVCVERNGTPVHLKTVVKLQ